MLNFFCIHIYHSLLLYDKYYICANIFLKNFLEMVSVKFPQTFTLEMYCFIFKNNCFDVVAYMFLPGVDKFKIEKQTIQNICFGLHSLSTPKPYLKRIYQCQTNLFYIKTTMLLLIR